jgi:hypothetical protein
MKHNMDDPYYQEKLYNDVLQILDTNYNDICYCDLNVSKSVEFCKTIKEKLKAKGKILNYSHERGFIISQNHNRLVCGSYRGHRLFRGHSFNFVILNKFNECPEKVKEEFCYNFVPVWWSLKHIAIIITLNPYLENGKFIDKLIKQYGIQT